jgi:hypothetical protein
MKRYSAVYSIVLFLYFFLKRLCRETLAMSLVDRINMRNTTYARNPVG